MTHDRTAAVAGVPVHEDGVECVTGSAACDVMLAGVALHDRPRPPTRRPRDRRQQILAAAAERFRTSGYHNVGMTEIADSVGITGPALYRHFRGKQDLLAATLGAAADQLAADLDGLADLDEALRALGSRAVERRATGVLWQREARHLPAQTRAGLRTRLVEAVQPLRTAIAEDRPALGRDQHDLLLWAVLAVFASPGYHAVPVEVGRLQTLLVDAARAVCRTYQPPPGGDRGAATPVPALDVLLPVSRREAVLTAATRLFTARGYRNVGMDDVGAAAGITGASVYHHFAGKGAILQAVLTRCLEALMFDLTRVFDATADPGEALDMVLESFVRTSIERGRVVGALLDEIVSLPADARESIRQAQRTYVAEWAGLLARHRPDVPEGEARALVHAAIVVVASLLRTRHVAARPTLDLELVGLGRAVLGLYGPAEPAGRALAGR
jgi:AcrR family transcriptional regulator